jgi:hypothetical protein
MAAAFVLTGPEDLARAAEAFVPIDPVDPAKAVAVSVPIGLDDPARTVAEFGRVGPVIDFPMAGRAIDSRIADLTDPARAAAASAGTAMTGGTIVPIVFPTGINGTTGGATTGLISTTIGTGTGTTTAGTIGTVAIGGAGIRTLAGAIP